MNRIKILGLYSGLLGLLFAVYGILEIVFWIAGPVNLPLMPAGDVMGGFILILIGSLFLYRIKSLLEMRYEGLSFVFVALLISAITGTMYILIMLADASDALIVGKSWEFDASAYNLPAIALFLLSLPCWMIIKEREEFGE